MGKLLRFNPDRPLSPAAAKQRIKLLWNSGEYTFPRHAQERLLTRRWSDADINHLIETGRVVEHSRPKGLWRYKLTGKTVDGHSLSAVFEIAGNLLVLVTVLPKGR